ncbi:MAG: calcium-binding protein [Victivallaceae bacterium]|nr:calcium-binding protein [Victivallaceae bacterium]
MSRKKTKAQKRFERQRRALGGTISSSVEVHGNTMKIKQTFTANDYDIEHSWDDGDDEKWDEKFEEWESRDWESWLNANLEFPFTARREEDDGESFFGATDEDAPFSFDHTMRVIGLDWDPGYDLVLAKVKEGNETGFVPLCDLVAVDNAGGNYWPVREYAVWVANR